MMKSILFVVVFGFATSAHANSFCFERTTLADQLPAQVCLSIKHADFAYGSLNGQLTVDGDYPGILNATRDLAGEDIYEIHATLLTKSFREPGCNYAQRESIDVVIYATESNEIVGEPALVGTQEETQDVCHSNLRVVKNISFVKKTTTAPQRTIEFKHLLDPGNPEMPPTYETLLSVQGVTYTILGDELTLQGKTSSGDALSLTLSSHKPSARDISVLSYGTLSGTSLHGLSPNWTCTTTHSELFPQGRKIECSRDMGWFTTSVIELPE